MNTSNTTGEPLDHTAGAAKRDEELWQVAKRRAGFKYSLLSYIVVNLFLIAIWYFSTDGNTYFWPMWPLLGWGIGLLFQYLGAYHGNTIFSAEREYEKIKNKQ